MPLLVDGHNLIGQMPGLSLALPDDEAQLVMLLRRYVAQKRGRRVVVVFDRGVYGHPYDLNGYGVECSFAKSPRDADDELIRRIRSIKRQSAWQVVTSDRAVAGEARAHKVRVIPSHEFARQLIKPRNPVVRREAKYGEHPLKSHEIEEWLRLFGAEDEL
ncbi:MAG: hypothetical protein HC884_03525 [Chloroflexaceae bacterium]|nr:hypothetical protein [Chloroflexaceae bacterium]